MSWTILILIATVFVSYLAFDRPPLKEMLVFYPYQIKVKNEWHRILTHAFIHADYTHLVLNAFVLWQFGTRLEGLMEQISGPSSFALLYFGGAVFAAIPGMLRHHDHPHYKSLGASGAVSAVLIAYILYFPTSKLLLFLLVPLPAFVIGILFFVYEHQMDKRSQGNIAHDAHLWGGLFGLIFTILINPKVIPMFLQSISEFLSF